MAQNTAIEWTDATFNPWIGCSKVSEGCRYCYAESFAKRFGRADWGPEAERVLASAKQWQSMRLLNNRARLEGKTYRVFCGSMCDVFERSNDAAILEGRPQLWKLIEETQGLDWLLLTKRPEYISRMIPGGQFHPAIDRPENNWLATPPANVWYGTSIEDQKSAGERLPELARVPALCRFISAEPLLGPITLKPFVDCPLCARSDMETGLPAGCEHCQGTGRAFDWIILGGESGPHARPCRLEWIRDLAQEALFLGLAVFLKQIGSHALYKSASFSRLSGGLARLRTKDSKGGDPAEWPYCLPPLREFPDDLADTTRFFRRSWAIDRLTSIPYDLAGNLQMTGPGLEPAIAAGQGGQPR